MTKIKTFKDLKTWQVAHQLVLDVYKLTKAFPREEMFGLVSQVRRAVVSVTSNIAEGFSRKGIKEKRQFLYMALGSLSEVESQVMVAFDLGYVKQVQYKNLDEKIQITGKLINGLLRSLVRF